MHCGLRKISCVFPAKMTTCAHSRSPRNNSVRPYLSCRSCVIPIATPQRWQIRAGVARTQAGRRTRTGAHAAFSFWRNHVGLFKINQAQSGCGSGIHAHRIPSWQTQNTRRQLWKRSGTSPCLSVCLCRLSACGLHAHYQNKQRWGWKNGVHTLNKTGGKKIKHQHNTRELSLRVHIVFHREAPHFHAAAEHLLLLQTALTPDSAPWGSKIWRRRDTPESGTCL